MTNRLTDRAIYTAIVEGTFDTLDKDSVQAWAEKKIAQIDHKAERARAAAAQRREEGDALTEAVLAVMTDEFEPIADIAARVDVPDATVSKITYRLNAAAKAGKLEKGEVVIETDTSKRKVVAYRLPQ